MDLVEKAVKVSPKNLRWQCNTKQFKFKSTSELQEYNGIIAQEKAVEAIRLGAELYSKGYNIFVTGLSGTGRMTAVKRLLEQISITCPILYDYCYVNNFEDNSKPILIKLPKGKAKFFAQSMKEAVESLSIQLAKIFDEEPYLSSKRNLVEHFRKKEAEIIEKFDKILKKNGFVRGQIENEQGMVTPEIFPVIEGEPVQLENMHELVKESKLSQDLANKIEKKYKEFQHQLFELSRSGMKMMREFRKEISDFDKQTATPDVEQLFNEIAETYKNEKLTAYIEAVKKFTFDNLNLFINPNNSNQNDVESSTEEHMSAYVVNVLLDNSNTDCAPVIIETSPNYTNLFGSFERVYDTKGVWRSDFTKIKAGSILQADQGYLIVNAQDLFTEPGVWNALKRVLLYNQLEIQPLESVFQISQSHMKPEYIEVNVKVVVIGGQSLYQYLYDYEKGFKKIFKVNAQFDYENELNNDIINSYATFIAGICRQENLPHCNPDGVAAIIEWGVEHAGSQDKISLKFSDVADLIRESAYYLRRSTKNLIGRQDVETAIKMRKYRNNMIDEKLIHQIKTGNVLIDTSGDKIGQVNGLTVLDTGLVSFGKPAKITAVVSAGSSGVVNIEREVHMSGKIHSKAVMTITSFIQNIFASDKPVVFNATVAFEQNYGGIDGDSASIAELYIILSALAKAPIKQSIAVTGSINQFGDVQPVGGVNEKITGFFEICKIKGLDGSHGIILPHQNVKDLMLNNEIIEAVKNKQFTLYSVKRIEEVAPVLMGLKFGIKNEKGEFSKNSLSYKVIKRIDELRENADTKNEHDNKNQNTIEEEI